MERTTARHREAVSGRVLGFGALSGVAGGLGMAMWQMLYSAGRGDGFWTPLNVCMASFVYRSEAKMMVDDMMMHPGMSMNEPVQASHLAVGAGLHFAFSAVVGIAFALVLWELARAGLGRLLSTYQGYVAASVAGGVILYLVMWYLVLPWANAPFKDLALRGPFFVAHIVYGLVFGLVAFPFLARRERTTKL
ncbi:MAG: hypothetical protein E6G37_04760 [Actinobacteria bacterium]|nr:MAG: hypothetical protein E6G37_04760 [Actinomycetota bacterium]TMM25398.1 MAG: hypothetical protein E6F95_01930 [Actinomycetota bacterium]